MFFFSTLDRKHYDCRFDQNKLIIDELEIRYDSSDSFLEKDFKNLRHLCFEAISGIDFYTPTSGRYNCRVSNKKVVGSLIVY